MPSGQFLMEILLMPAGFRRSIRELVQRNLIHRDALTINGKTIWENCQAAPNWNPEVIAAERPLVNVVVTLYYEAIWRPTGPLLKPSAASPTSDAASRTRCGIREYRTLPNSGLTVLTWK